MGNNQQNRNLLPARLRVFVFRLGRTPFRQPLFRQLIGLFQLECWQLTCQFPTWQSPACSSSDRRNYESRGRDQQT